MSSIRALLVGKMLAEIVDVTGDLNNAFVICMNPKEASLFHCAEVTEDTDSPLRPECGVDWSTNKFWAIIVASLCTVSFLFMVFKKHGPYGLQKDIDDLQIELMKHKVRKSDKKRFRQGLPLTSSGALYWECLDSENVKTNNEPNTFVANYEAKKEEIATKKASMAWLELLCSMIEDIPSVIFNLYLLVDGGDFSGTQQITLFISAMNLIKTIYTSSDYWNESQDYSKVAQRAGLNYQVADAEAANPGFNVDESLYRGSEDQEDLDAE